MSQESAGFSAPSVSSTFSWRRRRRKANEGNKLVELFAFRVNLIDQHIFNRQDNSHVPHRTGRVGRALTHRFTFQGKETFASLYSRLMIPAGGGAGMFIQAIHTGKTRKKRMGVLLFLKLLF